MPNVIDDRSGNHLSINTNGAAHVVIDSGSAVVGLSTSSIVGLSTSAIASLTSSSIVGLSSSAIASLATGTTVALTSSSTIGLVAGTAVSLQLAGTNVSASNPVPASLPVSTSIYTGQGLTTGSQVQIHSGSQAIVNQVTVKSNLSNVTNVSVGLTGVNATQDGTGNGYILNPGDSVDLPVSNLNLVYINGAAGAIVSYMGN